MIDYLCKWGRCTMDNTVSAPKTNMFRFRINSEVREQIENIYAQSGLSFTQTINAGGLPFPVNESNGEYMKANAMKQLLAELEAGKNSGNLIDADTAWQIIEGVAR